MAAVPEVAPGDAEGILDALKRTSCVLIRGALPADRLRSYSEAMRDFYARTAAQAENVPETEVSHRADILRTLKLQGGIGLAFRPEDGFEAPSCFHDIGDMIRESGLLNVAGEFLRDDAGFLVDYCSMRRQAPDALDCALRWHQDGQPATMPSADHPGLVFWIPLVPVDPETPGLEVVAKRIDELLPHRPTPRIYYSEIDADHAELERRYREHLARTPDMRVGDVLLFTFTYIHRSYVTASMTKPRFSLDLRCVPLTGLPPTYRGAWGFRRAVLPPAGPRPFYFIAAFWGEEDRDRFLRPCLASLLSPNNLPALENLPECRLLVSTTEADRAALEDDPTFRALARRVRPLFMKLDPPESDAFAPRVLAQGYNQGATRAFEDRAYGVFLSPDLVLSDGTVAALARRAREETKAVLCAEVRAEAAGCLEELEAYGSMQPGEPLTLPPRTLAGVALRHPHPDDRRLAWDSPAFADAPHASFWHVPDGEGILMHSLRWRPLLVDYGTLARHHIEAFEDGTPYGERLFRSFTEEDVHLVTDSDEVTLIRLAKDTGPRSAPETHWAKRTPVFGDWVKTTLLQRTVHGEGIDPLKHRLFSHAVRVHGGPVSPRWKATERRAARRVRRASRPVSAFRERSVDRVLAFRPYLSARARLARWKADLEARIPPEWRQRTRVALALARSLKDPRAVAARLAPGLTSRLAARVPPAWRRRIKAVLGLSR